MGLRIKEFKISVKAMRSDELINIITDGDADSKLKKKVQEELDRRYITLNNARTYR